MNPKELFDEINGKINLDDPCTCEITENDEVEIISLDPPIAICPKCHKIVDDTKL